MATTYDDPAGFAEDVADDLLDRVKDMDFAAKDELAVWMKIRTEINDRVEMLRDLPESKT